MHDKFIQAMENDGISPSQPLVYDGNFRRFNIAGDKKGRRNGWYRYVRVSENYAWGVYGSNKTGLSAKWASKGKSEITGFERKEEARKHREIAKQALEMRTKAAIRASRMWAQLSSDVAGHDYLRLKNIHSYGLKRLNNNLVIPIYSSNQIVSLQYIYPDGQKLYMEWGQKEGAYFWIGDDCGGDIWIAEGYATAASIHQSIGAHVIIAFDAGNIPHVAKIVRDANPDRKIIIAADNDQWTKGNPGVAKAQEAQSQCDNIEIKFPPFNYEDKSRPTDWNDYANKFGMEALRNQLSGVKPERKEIVVAEEKKWRLMLIEGKQELPGYVNFDPKSKQNAFLFVLNHEKFKDLVALNIFSGRVMLTRCPPWESPNSFVPRQMVNRDFFNITVALESFGIRTSKDIVEDIIEAIAEERKINPPRDYLEKLKWDCIPRIDKWLTYYLGAERQNPEYLALVGSKWLMGAVSRVYEPGVKFDNVLILEGGQDNKKSMLFKRLTTFDEAPYFLEFAGDVTNKDSLGMMQGRIVVEMSELASVRRAIVEEMKTFVTREIDTFRPAWGRTILEKKRQFVLAATTNNDSSDAYLVDPTGNRRYWPVGCGIFDMEALINDKDQLWAEAVVRWKSGEKTWLDSAEEKELAKFEQNERQHEDAWIEPIQDYLIGKMQTDIYRICKEAVGLTADQIRKPNEDRARACLKKLGWQRGVRKTTEEGKITIWIKKL